MGVIVDFLEKNPGAIDKKVDQDLIEDEVTQLVNASKNYVTMKGLLVEAFILKKMRNIRANDRNDEDVHDKVAVCTSLIGSGKVIQGVSTKP